MPNTASKYAQSQLRGFGARLRELRQSKGMTQEQLAERSEIVDRNISRYETGDNLPNLENLLRLAWALEVDVAELLAREP